MLGFQPEQAELTASGSACGRAGSPECNNEWYGQGIDGEIVSTRLRQTGSNIRDVPQLSNWQEETDSHVISHVEWTIRDGC